MVQISSFFTLLFVTSLSLSLGLGRTIMPATSLPELDLTPLSLLSSCVSYHQPEP
ncbi:hypothetical protein IE53DRAFT_386226 [Violaceomyces palustris]|uniref:Uncharacterized protein n=1 Tax=Violaceomyces palustris TaxID=1673888 RepID=A0ACD0NZY5_9BASI|nr:hypothetical protein IE53DRAFT_386226 [Violaceomyces palustris]